MPPKQLTVFESLVRHGISRRGFLKLCALAASALALPPIEARRIAAALETVPRPRVVWLHFQECTACTEALTRAFGPSIEVLLLEMIALEYHETLMVAAGTEAIKMREAATESDDYILIVEGSVSH